jgi:uncharacterized protein with HEPN domain
LLDIVEAIDKIGQRASRDIDDFADDEMQQVWVIHHLQIMGEAASRVSENLRSQHPEVPWDKMIGMRHVPVHGYFQIDLDAVWAVMEKDLRRFLSRSKESSRRKIESSSRMQGKGVAG